MKNTDFSAFVIVLGAALGVKELIKSFQTNGRTLKSNKRRQNFWWVSVPDLKILKSFPATTTKKKIHNYPRNISILLKIGS